MTPQKDEIFYRLAERCRGEFEIVSDYIWKTPEFIEQQVEVEKQKLVDYFPLNGDPEHDVRSLEDRKLRGFREFFALYRVFPFLMATSNFLIAISLFESYCLLLCKEIEIATGMPIPETRGPREGKILNRLSAAGILFSNIKLHEQVVIAFKFRNCLTHASGLLRWYKSPEEIRSIVTGGRYFSAEDRERRRRLGERPREVSIQDGGLGDQLVVNNMYSWRLASYFRDYYEDLCKSAHATCFSRESESK